jgi:hypothetical protein
MGCRKGVAQETDIVLGAGNTGCRKLMCCLARKLTCVLAGEWNPCATAAVLTSACGLAHTRGPVRGHHAAAAAASLAAVMPHKHMLPK